MIDAIAIQCGPYSSGSAIAISASEAITAYHVVRNGRCSIGAQSAIDVRSTDRAADFAVVVSRTSRLGARVFGYSCDGIVSGQTYQIVGRFGRTTHRATGRVVRTVDPDFRYTFSGMAEMEGSSESGMSGGGVIDANGKVVAVVSSATATHTFARPLSETSICKTEAAG